MLESAEPDGQVSVYFPGEGDVLKMMRKDVRTALTWDGAGGRDGTWYVAGTDELVTPAGKKGVGEEAEEKEDTADEENGDGHVDMCMVCLGPGSLICCDGCPGAYHMSCVGETRASLPDDDWYCPECVALPRGLKVGWPLTLLTLFFPLFRIPQNLRPLRNRPAVCTHHTHRRLIHHTSRAK